MEGRRERERESQAEGAFSSHYSCLVSAVFTAGPPVDFLLSKSAVLDLSGAVCLGVK